mgnify:CR=1 FL=1
MDYNQKVLYKQEWKFTGQKNFRHLIKSLVWEHHPAALVHGTPVRYAAVIAFQSKMIGVIDLIAEEHEISTVPCVDNTCKKTVLGNGAAHKEEIMAKYGEESEHVADCMMFGEYFLSFQDK